VLVRYERMLDQILQAEWDGPSRARPASYYGPLLDPRADVRAKAAERKLRYHQRLFQLAHRSPERSSVLEVGTAWGLVLPLLVAMGAAEAHGIDIAENMLDYARAWREVLPDEEASRIEVGVGDAASLPFPDERYDVLLSVEAISHYLDYQPFLSEAHRVLRGGGSLLVADGNNGLNPLTRRRNERIWASHEVDPRVEEAHGERPEDHPHWMVRKREVIIHDHRPALDAELVHRLAINTSGMVRAQVVEAVDRYVTDGVEPSSPYRHGTVTVNPQHDMYMERLFDPFSLARELEQVGFEARVHGHWGSTRGWQRTASSVLGTFPSRLMMPVAPSFLVVGVKRS
jgi:ubiquinone/menaquinone biosynthesis C-methylase UbiE